MLRNYLKITFRNLLRNKAYLVINTLGLGIALACCMTAYLLLAFNIEFDKAFSDEEVQDVFAMHTHVTYTDGNDQHHLITPISLGPAIANDLSGIKRYSRWIFEGGAVSFEDKVFNEGAVFTDPDFFKIFDEFQVVEGSLEAFEGLNKVVLTDKMAKKYFPDEPAQGKILNLSFPNAKNFKAEVVAVVEKPPLNSTLVFDVMMPIEHFMDIYDIPSDMWSDWRNPALFVQLDDPQNAGDYTAQMSPYIERRNAAREDMVVNRFELEPFKANFNQDDISWSQTNLRISTIPLVIFSVLALMILMVACFNLSNTSFAMAARRLKEVGVRKVIGATRVHIVIQFLLEMMVTIFIATVVGLAMSNVIVPEFALMWGLDYGLADLNGVNLLVSLLLLVFISSTLAGLYPAMFNSKFQPAVILKGNAKVKGTNFFTKTLVGIQFAISVIVLINGIIFISNTRFQEEVDFGFAKDDVITIAISDNSEYEVMKAASLLNPDVTDVGITHHTLGWSSYPFPVTVDTAEYQVQHIEVGENFFEIMEMKLADGRFLDFDRANDQLGAIVVNHTFLEKANIKDALGTVVIVRGERKRIVGVVEDHLDNLFRSKDPEPFVFYPSKPHEFRLMLVKAAGPTKPLMEDLEASWQQNFPDKPFNGQLQDEMMLSGMRQTNNNMKKIFIFLTILGGLLSASGIFALASLNVEKRTKEIGIRKVLGASIQHMIFLLSKEFSLILSIAAVIGSVGGFFLANLLLEEIYAYYLQVGPGHLILGAAALVLVGLSTCAGTVLKAARANPVRSLRAE